MKLEFERPVLKNPNLLQYGGYCNGKWLTESDEYFEVRDPATGETIAELPEQTKEITDYYIDAAAEAFKTFRLTSPRQRARWLRQLSQLMLDNAEDLAKILAWENGKALKEATGEINYAAGFFEWFAEEAPRIYGTTIQPLNPSNRAYTTRQPIGVCGLICPWNFPSAMITRKVGPALATGCTVVIKPDSQTPLSALALATLVEAAGFPKGVFNIILADKRTAEVGLRLCESPKVNKISFTGSIAVGKLLMKQSADTLKKLSLELGGNAPFIVFEDADMSNAVEQAILSKFRGMGQTCVCANRFYVHSSIMKQFALLLKEKVEKFVIGHGLSEKTTHGCLINSEAVEKVERHARNAISLGADVVLKGGPLPELGPTFYSPYILTNVSQDAMVCHEETFGPLCAIIPFNTTEEAVTYGNDSDCGLGSYVFSENIDRIYTVAEALENGMVSCNTGLFSDTAVPFGGINNSGFGREGSLHGVEEFTYIKSVTIGVRKL